MYIVHIHTISGIGSLKMELSWYTNKCQGTTTINNEKFCESAMFVCVCVCLCVLSNDFKLDTNSLVYISSSVLSLFCCTTTPRIITCTTLFIRFYRREVDLNLNIHTMHSNDTFYFLNKAICFLLSICRVYDSSITDNE